MTLQHFRLGGTLFVLHTSSLGRAFSTKQKSGNTRPAAIGAAHCCDMRMPFTRCVHSRPPAMEHCQDS